MTDKANCIGAWVVVMHANRKCVGTVIDCVAGTDKPKRVRIQWGDGQGEVLQPGQYTLKSWLKETPIDP
jgi:hypothetical protein